MIDTIIDTPEHYPLGTLIFYACGISVNKYFEEDITIKSGYIQEINIIRNRTTGKVAISYTAGLPSPSTAIYTIWHEEVSLTEQDALKLRYKKEIVNLEEDITEYSNRYSPIIKDLKKKLKSLT